MQRNLDRRSSSSSLCASNATATRSGALLELQLADTANAWELQPDGSFERLGPKEDEEPLDSQALLLEEGF